MHNAQPVSLHTDIQIVHSNLSCSLPSITMSIAEVLLTARTYGPLRRRVMLNSNCVDGPLDTAGLPTSADYEVGRLEVLLVWQHCVVTPEKCFAQSVGCTVFKHFWLS